MSAEEWSLYADLYDKHATGGTAPYGVLATALLRTLPRDARVLEVAAGSGWAAATLARDAPHLRVLATDFAPAMVALARARGVEARVADAAALGAAFDAATFDAVLSLFGVLVLPPAVRDAALRSARDVLAPGGQLVLSTWAFGRDLGPRGFHRALFTALAAGRRAVQPATADASGSPTHPSPPDADVLRAQVATVEGLSDVEVHECAGSFPVSVRHMVDLITDNPMMMATVPGIDEAGATTTFRNALTASLLSSLQPTNDDIDKLLFLPTAAYLVVACRK